MRRVPSSVQQSPCTHLWPPYRFLIKIPASYPPDAAGPIFCVAITMYSPLPPFQVLRLRYRTATHWTRLVPFSVPPSPCTGTHPLPTCRFLVKILNSYGTQWTRLVPSSVPPSPCTQPLLTLQVPGQDTGQLPTGRGGSHLLCRHIMYSPLPPLQVSG
jgi:hypothetical protein